MPTAVPLTIYDHSLLALIVAIVIGANVRRLIVRRARALRGEPPAPPRTIAQLRMMLLGVGLFVIALIAYWGYTGRSWALLGIRPPLMNWWGLAGVGLLIVQISVVGGVLLGELPRASRDAEAADDLIRLTKPLRRDQSDVPRNSLLVALLGAFEELCFRGFLYFYVAAIWGWIPAALIGWVTFALAHLSQGPRVAAICLFHGAIFTTLRVLTDSVLVSAVSHAAHNAIVVRAVRSVDALIASRGEPASDSGNRGDRGTPEASEASNAAEATS